MRVIAVDDEHLALKNTERAIKAAIPDCELTCFGAPSKALTYAAENQVDVAFLDIEMGGMSGLQLAKRLKDINGKTNIIFVTGYSDYAMEAFAMHVSGYILKPVSAKAISAAMGQLRYPVSHSPDKRLRVQTFGNFEVFVDEKPLSFARSKTKELLAYLVSRRGAQCSNNEVIAVIWEDKEDSPALQSQFRHLVSDLTRKLASAGLEGALTKRRGYLGIMPEKFACDLYDFCDGSSGAVNKYAGEFMAQYSWAEFTNAYLDHRA
ncbi:MAG: response regulator [Synergistaceae bacterium]|nr:response regulator [Synergistaceae bacterium]